MNPLAERLPDSPFATVQLRAVSSTDAPALCALLQQLGPDEARADAQIMALRLSQLPSNIEVLVAERDGQLLGTCSLHLIEHLAHNFARSAVLEDVVVDAQARGLGIGQALMAKAIERARHWRCYKVALSSKVSRSQAHAFYAKLGFTLHGHSLTLPLD
ncbi:GNAT family N-acetyltransferase [Pseudomonas sp. 5P_3.1_Bac2]|uniref:GNAT family N-acetyltransferase n=1 Tax=Pseudomonas sp. 5P_3.1_Bac2 TaxID=2971617 RepID=UPI0021C78950|nr:GNAT family N-acetyltransferase [Pseudomonas sp. 5P_3.1_Bac2]MCU1715891.1 GNAT family N-acetyltransferase [Pseudomonas sp. 5P_3.1_Bac2]